MGSLRKATKKHKKVAGSFDPQAFLATVGTARTITQSQKDHSIFSAGEPSDAIFYVQEGRVKLTVASKQGKEAVIAMLGPGDFFGEACLTGQAVRVATATSVTSCSILRIEKSAMRRVLEEEPALSGLFIAHLLSRNMRVEEDLADQLFNSSEKRLARALLLLAHYGNEGKPDRVVPEVSQQVLAEMIGTTRSRVSFFMNRFRRLGFIKYNGGFLLCGTVVNLVLKGNDEGFSCGC